MKHKRQISILLAVALILGCTGWTPATAQQIRKDNTAPSAPEAMNMESLVEDTQILDYVDSEQFLQADHVARLPQEETLDSYVFLNRDGTRSVYYMGRPVKYVDENGAIHEKDTTLVRSTGGYGMRDNDVALHIPDAAATGITLSHNQRSIKLTPQGGSGTAQMADNSIDYVNFFGKGTILRYTPMLSGMKEDIILAEYTGQNSFTFLLETNGLNLYQDQGRYYLAESQDAEAAFYLGQIDVYDAIGRPDLGTMTAETIVPGQRYRLTVSADEEFLTDPETVYPVAIDPTLTVRDSEDVRGTLEDTPVFSNYPIRNFGDYTFNSMGYVEGFGTAITAVRLTGLLADTNYAQLTADQLNSVTFHIKSAGGSYANISVHALTENSTWTEMGLTWNTLGAYTETAYATQAMGNVLWDAFNITNLAKEWKNGTQNPQCGFVLISDSTTIRTATYGGEYGTIDYRPYVKVDYAIFDQLNHDIMIIDEGEEFALSLQNSSPSDLMWESSDPNIAVVDNTGKVTGLKSGIAVITANSEDFTYSPSCTVYVTIKDGVYYLRNVESGLYLDVTNGGVHPGTAVQQYTLATTYIRNQLFKITLLYADDFSMHYSIRSMTNSGLGLTAAITNDVEYVTIENMSTKDLYDVLPWTQTWEIATYGNSYTINNGYGENARYLSSVSANEIGTQVVAGEKNANYSLWDLIPYTGEDLEGIGLLNSVPDAIMCGNNSDYFNTFMFSTKIGCNGPVKYSVGEVGNSSTTIASIDPNTGFLYPEGFGSVWVLFTFDGSVNVWGYSVDIIPAGCREYVDVMTNTDYARTMNCQGYAFGTFNNPRFWQKDENGNKHDVFNWVLQDTTDIDSNDILYGTDEFAGLKEILETYYLDVVFENRWKEVYTNNDGWDVELEDNQFLVVFRVGKHGADFDYHFWYRTDVGRWANKHGTIKGSEYLHDMPSNDQSLGWKAYETYGFYDSDIIYYVITQEG